MVSTIVTNDRRVNRPAHKNINCDFNAEEFAYPSSIFGRYGIYNGPSRPRWGPQKIWGALQTRRTTTTEPISWKVAGLTVFLNAGEAVLIGSCTTTYSFFTYSCLVHSHTHSLLGAFYEA